MREVLFVAGEVSGDQHAAGVALELRTLDPSLELVGVGGDRMRDAGVRLIAHVKSLAVMGLVEPLRKLPRFYRLRREISDRIATGRVSLVVLVDYAGFNMKVAQLAHRAGVPVLYFITPQVWASRAGRLAALARTVTRAAVILPFEEALLRRHGIDATFVGHPMLDRALTMPERAEARNTLGLRAEDRVLALFPGSRDQEIARHLESFVATAIELQRRDPGLQVVVCAAPHVRIPPERCPFPVVQSASFAVLRAADAALCKSGTTTLEAAVALCPLVIAYRTDALTYAIARRLVKVPFIGMVNLLAGREVAREFVQDALQPAAMADALEPLLDHRSPARIAMLQELEVIRASLGEPGSARRVAAIAMDMLSESVTGVSATSSATTG